MKPLIIIAGPTAVGKSDLAVSLAKRINGAVISADSMQVYKGMDIGSAKITSTEMQGVKHYLIDILDPFDDFSVALFQKYAKDAYDEIISNGQVPIIAGGTGFYIQSVLYDIDFEESNGEISEYRQSLEAIAKNDGPEILFEMLRKVDSDSCEIIHKNNVKRVIRALEFYHETGTPISKHNETMRKKSSPYDFCYFVLNDDRETVYDRIDRRVDKMVEMGLVEEVSRLREMGLKKTDVSMQGLGYKEILRYLDNEITLEDALYLIKRDSRHFAKKQITWFNREPDVIWLNKNDFNHDNQLILDKMVECCKEKGII